jgi:facilitated trehalose transporter
MDCLIEILDKTDAKIDAEIQRIVMSKRVVTEHQSVFAIWKEFSKPELYKPFLIMIAFFAIQQFSGIFTIFIYAAQFSLEAGVAIDEFLSAVIIGAIRFVTTFFVAFASDKFGRKPLAISSGVGMFICMTGLTACTLVDLSTTNFKYLPAVFLFAFIFTGTFGILTLPFAMVAEMYPQKTRSFAVGITVSIGFILSFINIKTFSSVFEIFGSFWMFSSYTFIALLGIFFAVFVLPETRGKSLQEIESLFRKQ